MSSIQTMPVRKGGRLQQGTYKCYSVFKCVESGELKFTFSDGTTENREYDAGADGEKYAADPWVSVEIISGMFDFA